MTRFWNWYAYIYDSVARLVPYQMLLHQVIDCIPDRRLHLLDAGCGTGNFLLALKKRRPLAAGEGVDFSSAMLRRARAKLPGVEFAEADLNGLLPYRDACFDVVVCINALYAVRTPQNTVDELKRILKEGGMLIVSTPKAKPRLMRILMSHLANSGIVNTIPLIFSLAILAVFNAFIVVLGRRGHYHFLQENELRRIMQTDRVTSAYADQNWLAILHRSSTQNSRSAHHGRE